MRAILVILSAILVVSCAQPIAKAPEGFEYSPIKKLVFVDNRPERDSKYEVMSFLVSSCLYGTARRGDSETLPSKMEVLNQELIKTFGKDIEAHKVSIDRYFIFLTSPGHGQKTVQSMQDAHLVGGAIPSLLGASNCKSDDLGEAAFNVAEVDPSSLKSTAIIVLQANFSIDGKTGSVRIVRPAGVYPFDGTNPEWSKLIFGAMTDASKQISAKIADLSEMKMKSHIIQ